MSQNPRVSVVIPVYNGEVYVRQAVESMLEQTFTDIEVIVVDDGSSDGTLEILKEMQSDQRLRVLSRPNTGIVGALNDGLAVARGEYIARMDADDIAFPTRLAKQVAYLDLHPDVVIVGSMWIKVSESGELQKLEGREYTHDQIEQALLHGKGQAMMHPAVMIRRSALEQVGGYRREYQYAEDFDLFLRLAEVGRLHNLAEPLLYRRSHSGSICAQRKAEQLELKRRVLRETAHRRNCEIECERLQWNGGRPTHFQRAFNSALSAHRDRRRPTAMRDAMISILLGPWRPLHWQPLLCMLGRRCTAPGLGNRQLRAT